MTITTVTLFVITKGGCHHHERSTIYYILCKYIKLLFLLKIPRNLMWCPHFPRKIIAGRLINRGNLRGSPWVVLTKKCIKKYAFYSFSIRIIKHLIPSNPLNNGRGPKFFLRVTITHRPLYAYQISS